MKNQFFFLLDYEHEGDNRMNYYKKFLMKNNYHAFKVYKYKKKERIQEKNLLIIINFEIDIREFMIFSNIKM